MRKRNLLIITVFIAVGILTTSCSEDILAEKTDITDVPAGLVMEPVKTGYERAIEIARTAPFEVYDRKLTLTKSGVPEIIPGEPIMNPRAGAVRANSTEEGECVQDTLMYVFNYPDEEGYMVIATDEWGGEIMVFGDSGNFNVQDTVGNSLASFLVNNMIDYLLYNDEPRYTELTAEEIEEILAERRQTETKALVIGNTYADGQKLIGYSGNGHIAQWVMQSYSTLNFGTPCNPPWMPPGVPGNPDAEEPGTGNPNDPDPEVYYNREGCLIHTQRSEVPTIVKIGPLLKTKWGQGRPYNEYTQRWTYPHIDIDSYNDTVYRAATGCGATAIAQILAYHKYPDTYPFSTVVEGYDHIFTLNGVKVDSVPPGASSYDFRRIYQRKLSRLVGAPTFIGILEDFPTKTMMESSIRNAKTARTAVGQLMRVIGEKIDMWYTYDKGSGVWKMWFSGAKEFLDCFEAFGYKGNPIMNDHKIEESFWMIKESIDLKRPVLAWGFTDWLNTQGHIWVIDGYLKQYSYMNLKWDYRFDELRRYNGCIGPYGGMYSYIEQMHCNFGWNGKSDGYYNTGIFTVDGDTYKYKLKFIPYITPNR